MKSTKYGTNAVGKEGTSPRSSATTDPRTHGGLESVFCGALGLPLGPSQTWQCSPHPSEVRGHACLSKDNPPKKNMGNMKHSLVSLAIPLLNWAGERLNAFQIWLTSRKIPSSMLRVDSPKPNIQLADRPSRLFSQRLTMHRYRNESGSCSWKTWMSRAKSWWHGAKHESNILSLIEKSLYKCRKLVVTLPPTFMIIVTAAVVLKPCSKPKISVPIVMSYSDKS